MAKTTPTISVIERRLQSPNVFRASSQPIALVDPKKWTVRWENSEISPEHLSDMIHVKGWVYAELADLACPIEEIGATVRDGRVVRGERGREVLMKMLVRDYSRVQKKKQEETIRQTFGAKQIKDAIVSGAAAEHGEQAAEFLQKNVNAVTVQDSRGPEE
jgi:hypothetical protein